MFLIAYILLKRRHPEKAWMYGKHWSSAVALSVLPAIGCGAMTVLTIMDDYEQLGIPNIR
jgi:hypothetical protein